VKGVVLTGFGGPERLALRADLPEPDPPRQWVGVRVSACGVNNTDIWTRLGAYGSSDDPGAVSGPRGRPIHFPLVQGADAVGLVEHVGVGVDPSWIGRRVLVDPVFRDSPDSLLTARYLGSDFDGGFAERVIVPVQNIRALPEQLSDIEAATLATAAGTAMRMVRLAEIAQGDRVLVTGASGGVGSASVQIAAARGAHVIALAGRLGAEPWLLDLGARSVLHPDRVTSDLALDVVLDVVAGPSTSKLLSALRRGGRYVIAGASGGSSTELDMRTLYLGHLRVLGTSLFAARDIDDVLGMVTSGQFRPQVDSTFPLAEIADAQERFQSRQSLGKVVVTIA
jgi:NADPH:quinone reductase-like Zn-dependent oxidoreductase